MKLRPYQQDMIVRAAEALRSSRKILVQSATGSGKSLVMAEMVRRCLSKGKTALVMVPRRELAFQMQATMRKLGVAAGIIMAGIRAHRLLDVQIASWDTLHARAIRSDRMTLPKADVLVIDEAHLSLSPTRLAILSQYPVVVGFTATPAKGNGKGLGAVYEDLILGPPISQLIRDGFLVQPRYYGPSKPDLSKVRKGKDGDYREDDLAEVMDKPQLVGDIVRHWHRLAKDRKTVVFAVNVAHSKHLCEEFVRSGVRAEHVDGETLPDERTAILGRLDSGQTQVLTNVFIGSYGLDVPTIDAVVIARPTRSIVLYYQTVGRGLRPAPGKKDCLVIDHSGCVEHHGYVEDDTPWSLTEDESVSDRKAKVKKERKEPKVLTCPACAHQFKGARICPACGHQVIGHGKPIPVHEADLVELKEHIATVADKQAWWSALLGLAEERGKERSFAYAMYKRKFGVWPRKVNDIPIFCPPEVRKWVTSQMIRYANRRESA